MLEIVKAPNPVLSEKAKPVKKIDKGILKLIGQMKEALDLATDPIGVGLAAPQVSKRLQIFIAKPSVKSPVSIFINPRLIKKIASKNKIKASKTRKLEGCLSLPNIWGEVKRYPKILIEYTDETGKIHRKKFTGFMSTVIQHEIDHLNGTLFPKKVLEQKGTMYKSEKNEQGEDIFEELKI